MLRTSVLIRIALRCPLKDPTQTPTSYLAGKSVALFRMVGKCYWRRPDRSLKLWSF